MKRDEVLSKLSSCSDVIESISLHSKVKFDSGLYAYLDMASRSIIAAMQVITYSLDYDDVFDKD